MALRVEIGGGWMATRVEIFIIEHASYSTCYIRIANTKLTENNCLRQHVMFGCSFHLLPYFVYANRESSA